MGGGGWWFGSGEEWDGNWGIENVSANVLFLVYMDAVTV